MAAVGAKVPAATLYENTPGGAVTTDELFTKKRVVIFGVPGAFTPGCSKTHLPGASVRGGGRGAVMPFVLHCAHAERDLACQRVWRLRPARGDADTLPPRLADLT